MRGGESRNERRGVEENELVGGGEREKIEAPRTPTGMNFH